MLYILCWGAASERTVVTSKAGCQGRALGAVHDAIQTSPGVPRAPARGTSFPDDPPGAPGLTAGKDTALLVSLLVSRSEQG